MKRVLVSSRTLSRTLLMSFTMLEVLFAKAEMTCAFAGPMIGSGEHVHAPHAMPRQPRRETKSSPRGLPTLTEVSSGCLIRTAILSAKVDVAATAKDLDSWMRQVAAANDLVEKGKLGQAATMDESTLGMTRAAGDELRAAVVLQNLGRLLESTSMPSATTPSRWENERGT